jgi:hypothetical protein
MIESIEMLFWYCLAIVLGTMAKEMFYITKNQDKYSTGKGVDSQIAAWWKDRWDDTAFSFFFGGVAAYLFHTVHIDELMENYGISILGVSSEFLAAFFAMFSDTIMNRFRKKVTEDGGDNNK